MDHFLDNYSGWEILGGIFFFGVLLFLLLLMVFSLFEKEWKAFWRSEFCLIAWMGSAAAVCYLFPSVKTWSVIVLSSLFMVFIVGLFSFPKPREKVSIPSAQKRVDERDVIFSRFDLIPGSEKYKSFYSRKKEYKEIDDSIRELSDLFSCHHIRKSPRVFSLGESQFEYLEQQLEWIDGKVNPQKQVNSPEENSLMVKRFLHYLGADICGICELDPAYIYSHVGRGPQPYAQKIELNHRFAVAFAVEMDFFMVATAPAPPVIVETAKQYIETARISIVMADFIRSLGYPARAHIAGSSYNAMLPPIGWMAGLGEVGRIGILITEKYGPRVRLGLVTTDMPLIPDKQRVFGVQDFCQKCKKCAWNCPSQAIPFGGKIEENGSLRWIINREECYRFWRKVGTDCARCVHVCPYSKPYNFFHNLIRKGASFSKPAQTLFIWGDDFFYGRSPQAKRSPLTNHSERRFE